MKSLIAFSSALLHDMGEECHISTIRDVKTITERVEHEGISFLTISLSAFGKDLRKGLSQGFVAPDMFRGFARHAGLPRFLGGFLELVFDRASGVLLDNPSVAAIRAVHEFTSMFSKIELPCSDERVARAFANYVQCELDVRTSDAALRDQDLADFKRVGRVLFADVFTHVDSLVYNGEIIPKHGPGATAEKLSSNGKYTLTEWTTRLEEVFPFVENAVPNHGWWETAQSVTYREPGEEIPVRVISVPKTLKTPRIIAIEPSYMMFMQQGLAEAITEAVQKSDTLRQLMGWQDQEPNQLLACKGSMDGSLATLDLSEASDRVSNQHVRALLEDHPHLLRGVDACRSRKADVPGHGVIRLAKFASMGSALTFPIEAVVFTTLTFMGIERALNTRVSTRLAKAMVGQVRIYGDDIIVPVDTMSSVIGVLEAFGLRVNTGKSFGTGRFRESCGGDYYDGHRITPVHMNAVFPRSRKHVTEIVQTSALRNHLFEAGRLRATAFLDGLLGDLLPVYPEVPRTVSAIGRWTHEPIQARGLDDRTHVPFIKALVPTPRIPSDVLDGYGALMKVFLKRSDLPFASRDHLARAGRSSSVDMKMRKVPIIPDR